jgi:hypothetical protein
MSYTFDSKVGNSLLKEGEYEVRVERIETKTTTTGKEKIAIMFRVREDVEQEGKNRVLFEDIWKEKENPQFFNRKRLNLLLRTQDLENGKTFETIQDLFKELQGAMLIVKVSVEMDDYRGEEVNRIIYYRHTKNASKTVSNTSPKAKEEVKDEDLPF